MKTWLLEGRYYSDVIMTVKGETLEEAVKNAEDGKFLCLDNIVGGYQGFDWNKDPATVEQLEDL